MADLPVPAQPDPYPVDYIKSLMLVAEFDVIPKECYSNSMLAIAALAGDGDFDQIRYVEGTAVTPFGIPSNHGWLRLGNTIVDPTWASLFSVVDMATTRYFTATEYTSDAVASLLSLSWSKRFDLMLPLHSWKQGKRPRFTPSVAEQLSLRSAWHYVSIHNADSKFSTIIDNLMFDQLSNLIQQQETTHATVSSK